MQQPEGRKRNGPRFTLEQRNDLKQLAWNMHRKGGLAQLEISIQLDVSQASICRWIQAIDAMQPRMQDLIAAEIRAQLVCCDIYERFITATDAGKQRELRHSTDYHDICFYGEWSARIAEQA